MSEYILFLVLFIIATFTAIIFRKLSIPYPVTLVLVGLTLGITHILKAPLLTKEILFSFFLPGLLFEVAFHIDLKKLWRNFLVLSLLVIPGVFLSMILITSALTPLMKIFYSEDISWRSILIFSALISAIDPVATISIFKSIGAPHRLALLLEGESTLNDGTAVVFFTMSLALFSESSFTAGGIILEFVEVVGMGLLLGIGVGFAALQLFKNINDASVEIALTVIIAYGSFVLAENLHYSGIIAAVTSGLIAGNFAKQQGMLPSTRVSVDNFWTYLTFALNSLVFLLIGIEINIQTLINIGFLILITFIIVTFARVIIVSLISFLIRGTSVRISWKWSTVLIWGGLRGALPMVMVLTIPSEIPQRELLIHLTFGVAITSILLQGFTMKPLLEKLNFGQESKKREEFEYEMGKLNSAHAALRELDQVSEIGLFKNETLEKLKQEYDQVLEKSREKLKVLELQEKKFARDEMQKLKSHLLISEKINVKNSYEHGIISNSVQKKLLSDLNEKILKIESEEN